MNIIECQSATDLELARALLIANKNAGFVAVNGDDVHVSSKGGMRTLLTWFAQGKNLDGWSVACRDAGKAAAFLFAVLGPSAVFARTMTRDARAVLLSNGIMTSYDVLVSHLGDAQPILDDSLYSTYDPYDAIPLIEGQLAVA